MPKSDPSRTATLRRVYLTEMRKRFRQLKKDIFNLVVVEDAFGLGRDKQEELRSIEGESVRSLTSTTARTVSIQNDVSALIFDSVGRPRTAIPHFTYFDGTEYDVTNSDVLGVKPKSRTNQFKVKDDAFALNTRWRFQTTPEKVASFQAWLQEKIDGSILDLNKSEEDRWFAKYSQQGYAKGAGRAFDDVNKPVFKGSVKGDFFKGSKFQFLSQSFGHPVAIEKVKLLAGRVFDGLKNITSQMSVNITRTLTDGLVAGASPRAVARDMVRNVDKMTRTRALTIARTETIRAHAEGQLDALEQLGVKEIGVAVEWEVTGDDRVCPLCEPMQGTVFKIEESRNLIPRHPNCRCAFVPANVGEDKSRQKRSKAEVQRSLDRSVGAERPKRRKRTIEQQKRLSRWTGADKTVHTKRPVSVLDKPSKKARR